MYNQTKPGTVYLVGAGPGDPDLITVRGLRLLQQADVVVYDRLVHPDLVEQAPLRAERIYVGKAPGQPSTGQDEINRWLIVHARQGHNVVRLKGGDPFVFGRGGEEAQALKEAGIAFEIVPGISSAISAPAFAGIPVTHRTVSRAFTVMTGHTCNDQDVDWPALARAGTLVVLMGLRRLPEIARNLIAHGQSPDTPVAVVSRASTLQQEVVAGTLETIHIDAAHLTAPATIIVGDVVHLHQDLAWFEQAVSAEGVPEIHQSIFTNPLYAIPA